MKIVTALLLLFVCCFPTLAQKPGVVSGKDTNPGTSSTERIQDSLDHRLAELSRQITSKIEAGQKKTIAIIEFTDLQGNVTDLGRFLAEELVTRLYETEKFKVIERQLLTKVIAEQKLSLTGVVDPASAKQLGKLLGVDAIVSGTITNLAQSLKVNARLISTETGEVFAVAAAEILKDESVRGLLSSKTAPTSTVKTSSGADENAVSRVIEKEYIIELKSCQRSLNNVICTLIITNAAADERIVSLSAGESKMFDEAGNEYNGTQSVLGGISWDRTRYGGAYNTLVSQVPTKASIKFENVSSAARIVTLVISARPAFKVTLRNVELK